MSDDAGAAVSEGATAFSEAQADLVRVSTSLKQCITSVYEAYEAVYTMHTTCVHRLYVRLDV
jgi:hypothetical protein